MVQLHQPRGDRLECDTDLTVTAHWYRTTAVGIGLDERWFNNDLFDINRLLTGLVDQRYVLRVTGGADNDISEVESEVGLTVGDGLEFQLSIVVRLRQRRAGKRGNQKQQRETKASD